MQLLDPVNIHYRGAMNAKECSGIELRLHRAQGLPHHARRLIRMKMNIFIVSFDPVDVEAWLKRARVDRTVTPGEQLRARNNGRRQ